MYTTPDYSGPEVSICDVKTGWAINISLSRQGVRKELIDPEEYQRILEMREEHGIAPINDFDE